jgi:hypothetical protein
MDLPILPETYWNPYSKELCVDEILSQVITSPKWTVEESQRATQESWSALPLSSALHASQGCSSGSIGDRGNAHLSHPRCALSLTLLAHRSLSLQSVSSTRRSIAPLSFAPIPPLTPTTSRRLLSNRLRSSLPADELLALSVNYL